MTTFDVLAVKNEFECLLDIAQREPVLIENQGRPVVVVISIEEYHQLEKAQDALLELLAKNAEGNGMSGIDESEQFLKSLQNAKD